ncbi:MAG: hypothetical protein KAY32_09415 [Candidatus Eisenbacteria sp.]|nr:hypothetical protein [Candidatus Eisenbacteria bacterium]
MRKGCLSIEELAAAASWAPGDPRRRHLDGCTRCQSLLLCLDGFLSPADTPPGSDPVAARDCLVTDFRDEKPIGIPTRRHMPGTPQRDGKRGHARGLLLSLLRPAWRPILALAVLLVVVIELPRMLERPAERARIVLRDGGDQPDARTIRTRPPFSGDEAGSSTVILSWHPVAGIESYRVAFFNTDFQEIAWRQAGADTVMTLLHFDLPVPFEQWGHLFWQVTGWRGQDPVAQSNMTTLDLPEE